MNGRERGDAVADFVLVSGLLVFLFAAVLQLGFTLHVRNTLISCAAEGARLEAKVGALPGAGVDRARGLITEALSSRFAESVSSSVEVVDGVRVVVVSVEAPIPVIGPIGPSGGLSVVGRAMAEGPQ